MKIAIVSDWYSDGMGYAENNFPIALGKLGHEVHLFTSDLQVYATSPKYDQIYRSKLGAKRVPVCVEVREGFTLHRMHSNHNQLGIHIPNLADGLRQTRPEIVYCFEVNCPTTSQVARLRRILGYRMFCESRLHASIFTPPIGLLAKTKWNLRNRLIGLDSIIANVEKFYPLGPDVQSILTAYLGVPIARCELSSLAVDTELFSSHSEVNKVQLFRNSQGFSESDVVCVYTGRLTSDKGPHLLASAIELLHERGDVQFRGLFVGQGDKQYVARITEKMGCAVHPFVQPRELPNIYHSADIGVWPLQESTSQLDALACGLPIILNDTVVDPIRLGESTLTFKKNDHHDLAQCIKKLEDSSIRQKMGNLATKRLQEQCSWDSIAKKRTADFLKLKQQPN